jgi:hypothetical protein
VYAERQTIPATTAADGSATVYSAVVTGRISSLRYVKAVSGNFDDGVGITVTGETTGIAVLVVANMNASATYRPVAPASKAADGTASTLTETPIVLVAERLKVVIASGGNVKTGSFYLTVE